MGNNGDDAVYEDDDERRAAQYGSLSPIASAGGDPDAPSVGGAPRQGQVQLPNGGQVSTISGTGSNDPEYKPPPKPTNTAPPNNPPRSWQDYYAKSGLEGQLRNTVASENTAQYVANLPDEAATVRPLEAQRAAIAAQTPDPNADQYKPSIGQRIFRGVKAGVQGLAEGGVLGAASGAINADYKAPNRQYGIDAAKNTKQLGAADQQISVAQKGYQDATARAKANAVEQKATADEYGKIVTGATQQETEQNRAAQEADNAQHQRADEALRGQQEANTQQYQKGELKVRNAEVGVQAGQLQREILKDQFEEANGGKNAEDRQPLIDQATEQLGAFKDQWTYNPDAVDSNGKKSPNYTNTDKTKFLSPAEYIDQINKVSAGLDVKLAGKKLPPLGLRWKGGPNGQEIPIQTPPPQAPSKPQTITTAHSRQQISEGQKVMYQGKERVVKSVDPKTGKVTGFAD
jgi:hypothetical protein